MSAIQCLIFFNDMPTLQHIYVYSFILDQFYLWSLKISEKNEENLLSKNTPLVVHLINRQNQARVFSAKRL